MAKATKKQIEALLKKVQAAFKDGSVDQPRLIETFQGGWTLKIGEDVVVKDGTNRDVFMALKGFDALHLSYREQFINAVKRIG